ncbi:hypothetical protein PHLCEN_2v10925 [Hermanssonia centrifuga]|uniref:Conserved oligomeric Golgi complex subunit 2 n=1 Tax=Hermanssonia centrifuga TaxID=98765 RepID=A0A2R6NLI1_9APHY|nr:hypothetical protein PHLCEN_2v10925 [Hermanssonia centrifuga]
MDSYSQAGSSRDPMQLERLAEELATREFGMTRLSAEEHDLPIYIPLSHDNPHLSAGTFNVEDFLLSRAYTSLPDLRSELRDYLATLKEELVKLINDDYEAFISLSTDLRGEGARLERLKWPLGDLRVQVLAFLHLLVKISESVTRLESLLLITSPSDDEQPQTDIRRLKDEDGSEDRYVSYHVGLLLLRGSVEQGRTERSIWPVLRRKGKEAGKEIRATELEKAKWMSDVTECLRTYDMLGLWHDAEEVIRADIVREFVKKSIYPGALAAPHSPIVPHTPYIGSGSGGPPPTASLPPRTPYTPFTAFASKQNPFEATFDISTSHAHILDDTDDPLAALYNTLLRFVDRDMKRIMEVAEKVSVKPNSRPAKGALSRTPLLGTSLQPIKTKEEEGGFEIMANVVWAEIGKAVMEELGGVIFAAGNPDEFRKHHETTQAFIRSLEFLAPSMQAIEAMRAHPVYTNFERRWQLPVYFQLRWKEIVMKLEESLAATKLEHAFGSNVKPFATAQAAAIWEAITSCWSAQLYIPELDHRFWKLTLQSTPSAISRVATPTNAQVEASSPESVIADESLLVQFAIAITDVKAFEAQIWQLWRERLSSMLPDVSGLDGEENQVGLEDTLRHTLSSLITLIPPLSSQIIIILSRRGCDALLPMRSIPSQFRAMSSSKRNPTEASHFVALIFRSLKNFFAIGASDGPGAALKNEYLKTFATEVFEVVAQRYIYFLTAMKKTEESLRRLKKGKKSAFSLFGSSTASKDDDGRADEEKIRKQMILDVEAFGKDAQSLGVSIGDSSTYCALKELANANLIDD